MKKVIGVLLLVLVLCGCVSSTKTISMGGSNSVEPYMEYVLSEYMAEFPGENLNYDAPGSSKGISGVDSGLYQMGFASRNLKESEVKEGLIVEPVALDGIAIVTSKENPINNLTLEQLRGIYTGKISNWKEVGGNDAPISVVSRDSASGTREAFDSLTGVKDDGGLVSSSIEYDSSGAVAESVSSNVDGIGYTSFETFEKNKLSLKPIKIDGVAPTIENVQSGAYTLFRPFNMMYYEEKLNDNGRVFIEWLLLNRSELAIDKGYIPSN